MTNKQFATKFALPVSASSLVAFSSLPAYSQTAPQPSPTDVSATVTSVGTVAAGAVAIVLGAMGVRLAIKLVNRLSVKG